MKSVMFAIPAYRGIQCIPFTHSMEETLVLCEANGWDTTMLILEGNCYIQLARNDCVDKFMESDCDSLFFLDDDISWNAEDVLKLLNMKDEIVAGIYPYKTEHEGYPVVIRTDENHYPIVREDGCIRGYCVPTGFLRIKRSAIKKLMDGYPDHAYQNLQQNGELSHKVWDLFPQGRCNGRWVGEDFAFCNLWTGIDGDIWIVPDIILTHHGKHHTMTGNYHEFLKRQPRHE